jgi:RNA polymerase sigma-70 factor (ECF subfamily)
LEERDLIELVQGGDKDAFQDLMGFRMASSFYTWLYRIAVNLALDFRRQRMANPEIQKIVDPPSKERPDSTLLRKELNEHIRMTMAQLPPQHRAILLLRELEGLSYKEIAQVMGCRLGTVMSRLHYARDGMRRGLTPYLKGKD